MFKVRHSSSVIRPSEETQFSISKSTLIIHCGTKLTDRNESECLPIWKRFNHSQLNNGFRLDREAIQSEN